MITEIANKINRTKSKVRVTLDKFEFSSYINLNYHPITYYAIFTRVRRNVAVGVITNQMILQIKRRS